MRLEIPRPVCCQNCLAIGNTSLGKSTMCKAISPLEPDDEVGESEWIKNCTRRTVGVDTRSKHCATKKSRQWLAKDAFGNKTHCSFCKPNLLSQIRESWSTRSTMHASSKVLKQGTYFLYALMNEKSWVTCAHGINDPLFTFLISHIISPGR